MSSSSSSLFPVPAIHSTSLMLDEELLPNNGSTIKGLELVQNQNGSPIVVKSVSDDCPFIESAVEPGQILLTVHGVEPKSVPEAQSLMAAEAAESASVTLVTSDACTAAYTKLLAVPTGSSHHHHHHHPGVVFTSTRAGCLVQVSRVFPSGPWAATKLRVGDVVLAVNGIPVSKPDQADRALRFGSPHHGNHNNNHNVTVLYVLDMSEWRQSVVNQVMNNTAAAVFVSKLSAVAPETASTFIFIHEEEIHARLVCDLETQHVSDPERFRKLVLVMPSKTTTTSNGDAAATVASLSYNAVHTNYVLPFIKAFNEIVESRMQTLEEDVCSQAWKHLVETTMPTTIDGNHFDAVPETKSFTELSC